MENLLENSDNQDLDLNLQDSKEIAQDQTFRVALVDYTTQNDWLESYISLVFYHLNNQVKHGTKIFLNTRSLYTSKQFIDFLQKEGFYIYDVPDEEPIDITTNNLIELLKAKKEDVVCIIVNNLSDFYDKVNLEFSKAFTSKVDKYQEGELNKFSGFSFRVVENNKNYKFLKTLRLSNHTLITTLDLVNPYNNTNKANEESSMLTQTTLPKLKQSIDVLHCFDTFFSLKENGLQILQDRTKAFSVQNKITTKIKIKL